MREDIVSPSTDQEGAPKGKGVAGCCARTASGHAAAQGDESVASFDHLVGALLKNPGNVQTKRFRGLQVDHDLEFRWMLYR
jgi:hypothetical protein